MCPALTTYFLTSLVTKQKGKGKGTRFKSSFRQACSADCTHYPLVIGPFHSFAISFSLIWQLHITWAHMTLHSDMIVRYPTRYHLFTSMVRSGRPDNYSSGQCVVRDKPRTPHHIDRPARVSNPRPSGQHSTESPAPYSLG